MKLKIREKIADFSLVTSDDNKLEFSDIYNKNRNTLLLFLRYYGCTVCQLDLMEYKEKYKEFKDNDTEVVIVLQSEAEVVKQSGGDMPYIIACDPKMELYDLFEIKPAKSTMGLVSIKAVKKVMKAKKTGLEHGKYEGEELQLPAAFLVDTDGQIVYGKYAKNLGDLPTPDEFIQMVKK